MFFDIENNMPECVMIDGHLFHRLSHPPREEDVYRTVVINGVEYLGDVYTTSARIQELADELGHEWERKIKNES